MTYVGAQGNTAKEMKDALGLAGLSDVEMHQAFQQLFAALTDTKAEYKLHVANRLFAEQSYKFLDDFLNKVRTHYNAEATNLNFLNDPEAGRAFVNDWVEKQTNKKIQNLLPSGSVTSLTKMILVNAIYFKGISLLLPARQPEPRRLYLHV